MRLCQLNETPVTGSAVSGTKPLKIGDIDVATPVFLAPMSGVTDSPVRKLAAELGAGLAVSEMTASDELANGHRMSRLRCEATGIGPHVVQLAGCETHWMAEGARIAEAEGADIIDINMGCPARHVTGGQSGSALMRDLDHAVSLIEATIAAVKVPVTLKMRLGWDDRSRNAPELARRAEQAGVQMITVHGRTRCQFYKGTADWAGVRAVRDAVSAFPVSSRRPICPGSQGWPCAPRPIITASAFDTSSACTAFSNEVMSPLTTSGREMASRTARIASQSASPL